MSVLLSPNQQLSVLVWMHFAVHRHRERTISASKSMKRLFSINAVFKPPARIPDQNSVQQLWDELENWLQASPYRLTSAHWCCFHNPAERRLLWAPVVLMSNVTDCDMMLECASHRLRVVKIPVSVIINIILISVTASILVPRISHHYGSLTWNWSTDAHSGHIWKL